MLMKMQFLWSTIKWGVPVLLVAWRTWGWYGHLAFSFLVTGIEGKAPNSSACFYSLKPQADVTLCPRECCKWWLKGRKWKVFFSRNWQFLSNVSFIGRASLSFPNTLCTLPLEKIGCHVITVKVCKWFPCAYDAFTLWEITNIVYLWWSVIE